MPIGIIVRDGDSHFENGANGDGPVLGREHDIADLLRFIKHSGIHNTVWLTADVHYTAAHYYNPDEAQFQDFEPFYEFVSGPIHAGSFGPGAMDNTFGPQVLFSADPGGEPNLPPSDGLQFFGRVDIAADTGVMTVTLKDIDDNDLYAIDLEPRSGLTAAIRVNDVRNGRAAGGPAVSLRPRVGGDREVGDRRSRPASMSRLGEHFERSAARRRRSRPHRIALWGIDQFAVAASLK